MSNKNKSKYDRKNSNKNQDNIQVIIDYDKLATAIIKAQDQVELANDIARKKKEKSEKENWLKSMHQKEYKNDKNNFLKMVHSMRNNLVGIWCLITLKKDKTRTDYITFQLLQLACSFIFIGLSFLLYLSTILTIVLKQENKPNTQGKKIPLE